MQNSVTEYKALASILENTELLNAFHEDLFTDDRAAIYRAMRTSYNQYGEITPEGIEETYSAGIAGVLNAPSAKIIDPVLNELRRLRKKRYLKQVAQQIDTLSDEDDPNVGILQDLVYDDSLVEDIDTTLTAASMRFLSDLDKKRKGTYTFVSTGLNVLDVAMGGEWPKKAVSIIMANPGGSKTALIGNSALRMGMNNEPSLFLSLEMSREELISRWCADLCSINNADIRSGKVTIEQQSAIVDKANYINTLPIHVVDDGDLMIEDIIPIIRKYVKTHRIRVVFLDYLQIVKVDSQNKNTALGNISKMLKSLAKKLDIHICILSQKNQKDGVWSIRDSGDVPAAVDIIMNLEFADDVGGRKVVNIEFKKHRHGRLAIYPAMFNGPFLRYEDA